MGEEALFNLKWDAQRTALLGSMANLYREEAFVDTTIVADNKIFKAHKLLLAASSSYLKQMLESVPPSQHAVIFMPHIGSSDLGNLLKFIYDGEIKINKRSLSSFLSIAKLLKMDFVLNEDLEPQINPFYNSSSLSGPTGHKRAAMEARLDEDVNGSVIIPHKMGTFSSLTKTELRPTTPKENGNNVHSDEEPRPCRPAPISGGAKSTDSLSSQTSTCNRVSQSPRTKTSTTDNFPSAQKPEEVSSNRRGSVDEGLLIHRDDSNDSRDEPKNDTALNLHIGRYHNDNESIDLDNASRTSLCDNGDSNNYNTLSIAENEMDEEYDEEDDDGNFSMSIQPEISLRESDESFNPHDKKNPYSHKSTTFSNSLNLSVVENSTMSITPSSGLNAPNSPTSQFSLQQQLSTLKNLTKLSRPVFPKIPGQGSSHSGTMASLNSLNEGILMRMMREPLQVGTSKIMNGSANHGGFFDIHGSDPSLHSAGLRKQKRYVQCSSCNKVLSSLSALKRHMEDVHCARIQGKCLLCGRIYSSRNSLLTHVYSAHKKHHDYKAVARIIRESDFEQFATA